MHAREYVAQRLDVVRVVRGVNGLLERVDVRLRGAAAWTPFIRNIDYDPDGRRTRVVLGNDVETTYRYDVDSQRLVGVRSRRAGGGTILQDLGYTYDAAGFVVAITDYCGAQLRRWVTPEHWDKIRVVHCAVPDGLLERARPIDPDCRTITCIGRLCEQKGQLLLLEALRRVLDGGDELRLVLGGDGEIRDLVEERIAALDLTDHVEITGWIDADEVATRLLASRAMVLPSFAEGLPVVIMESLAVGRPVLSTYIAGIPGLVEPGTHGWLVPAGSVDALVEALREVARTPTDRLDEMGRAGTAAVRARHHLPTEVSRLEKCFQEFVRT